MSQDASINAGRLKHLEMIQQVINRLAGNSFLIKGWSITLTSALLLFIAKEAKDPIGWAAILVVLAFWLLDAIYLHKERQFRALYDHYRQQPQDTPTDFNMNAKAFADQTEPLWEVLYSASLISLHLPLFIGIMLVLILIN
ncbi:MAG: hypothetical protein WAQ53_05800 [Thiofilum sp.]|uniref:hypothetical protein n=1 Tax=Thiofilum sp. TaxID=2212733 RepID=UPI0025FED6CC|nr:hypothetical protein [Thiofilum sp.]MBK8453707.1 hypothetical protein [Thiofilum sp.]